ncbi:MAG: hypothetical protein JWP80_935 [Pseudomonas sp.]|nr:hypothetical protein [Pseudomonas sp.]
MNLSFSNHNALITRGKKWINTLFTESALIVVVLTATVITISLISTLQEITSFSTPSPANDSWQALNIALELQQLDLAARRAPPRDGQADQYDQLTLHIDTLLGLLSLPRPFPRGSMTVLSDLSESGTNLALIKDQLTRWSRSLSSPTSRQNVPEEVRVRAARLAALARDIVIDDHLATFQKKNSSRVEFYTRLARLRWGLSAILLGVIIVVAKLILDRHLNKKLSRSLSLLNRKLEIRVARRTQQLVEGRALLLFILDACPSEAALVQAESGKVHFINREFLERLNRGPHIETLFIQDLLVDTDERTRFMNELEHYGRVDNWETRIAANTPYWSSLSVKLVEVEGQLSYLLWGFDISKHKELLSLMEIQASTDVLTTLYNRRAFYERSTQILESCRHNEHPCSLLMVDIDNFKQVNDLHGHAIGDEAIRRVGNALKNSLREIDIIGRVGGEEFAVILPHIAAPQALETAERLRGSIEGLFIECSTGKLHLTVSIGVASFYSPHHKAIEHLISAADQALYRAKKSGRNRVEGESNEYT